MPKSDKRWLEAARSFDEDVLGEVYDTLSPELYRYAYRLVGEAETAEDLLSETFERFLRALHAGGGPKDHLRAYLYRTLHNLVVDRHRRVEPILTELNPDQIVATESSNPEVEVQVQLEGQQARALLWELTNEQRQVIVLKFFQGLSNVEIARVMEKSEGSIKALQHRGITSLRRLIEKRDADQETSG